MIIRHPVSYAVKAAFASIGRDPGVYNSYSFSPVKTNGKGRQVRIFGINGCGQYDAMTEAEKETWKHTFQAAFEETGGQIWDIDYEPPHLYGGGYMCARVILP